MTEAKSLEQEIRNKAKTTKLDITQLRKKYGWLSELSEGEIFRIFDGFVDDVLSILRQAEATPIVIRDVETIRCPSCNSNRIEIKLYSVKVPFIDLAYCLEQKCGQEFWVVNPFDFEAARNKQLQTLLDLITSREGQDGFNDLDFRQDVIKRLQELLKP
jgi:hypothetical protein